MASSDKAQYAIDIAAQMTGGAQTIDQLNALTDDLMASGKNADFFSQAIARVETDLAAAGKAAEVASSQLADGTARYKELEKAALNSAKAAERAALKHGGIIPKDLHDAAEAAKQAVDAEAVSLKRLEQAAASATGQHSKLAANLKNLNTLNKHVSGRLGDTTSKTAALAGALGDLGGPLGELGQKALMPVKGFSEIAEKFSLSTAVTASVVVGVVAVTVAVVALTAALMVGVGALAAWGVKLADQARTAGLAKEAFSALSEENAVAEDAMAGITYTTGITTDRLRDLTKQLKAAKVSADEMPAALRAAATAEAALGQGGVDQFLEDVKAARGEVGGLASDVQAKFGGIVSRQMLGLEAQGQRLSNNVGKLFSGLEIEPLLEGFSTLVNLFDENTSSGKALKFLFETILQPVINAFETAIPLVEAFFIGFLIGAMKIYIALKPAIKAISELLGFDDETSADTFKDFAKAGEIVAYVVGALILAFGVFALSVLPAAITALGSLIATAAVAAAPFVAIALAIAALGYAILTWGPQVVEGVKAAAAAIVDGLSAAWDYVKNLATEALTIGAQIMQGLARGIMAGAGAVVDAISGAVKGAINTAKSLLGIASPSKVFGEIGGFTTEGFTNEVEATTPDAQAAMAAMVEPPDVAAVNAPKMPTGDVAALAPTPKADAPTLAGESTLARATSPTDAPTATGTMASTSADKTADAPRASVNLSNVQFTFQGVQGAEDAEGRFRDLLVKLLDGTLTESGGAPA